MKCFVIMPFGNPKHDPEQARMLTDIYTQWIKPTVESLSIADTTGNITCYRADEEVRPGDIIAFIIENLVSADIVIADLSGKNPNVFYELGVRHSLRNNTILIASNLEDVPFDLRSQRTIIYSFDPGGMLKLKRDLENAINGILQELDKSDNPVQYFLGLESNKLAARAPGSTVERLLKEIKSLKMDLGKQIVEISSLMRLLTKRPFKWDITPTIKYLNGVWSDQGNGSLFCINIEFEERRFKIRVPYSYGTNQGLTAHFTNCIFHNRSIFARFNWFSRPISGYIFFTLDPNGIINGSWWYEQDLPLPSVSDIHTLHGDFSRMNPICLTKTGLQFPEWALEYFKQTSPE